LFLLMCEGGLYAGSDQRAERETEGDGKDDVTDAGAHGGGSLDVAKMGSVNADSAQELREN